MHFPETVVQAKQNTRHMSLNQFSSIFAKVTFLMVMKMAFCAQ